MNKKGIAALGDRLSGLAAGTFKNPVYSRRTAPQWDVPENGTVLLTNLRIVDVDTSKLRNETGLLIKGSRIESLVAEGDLSALRRHCDIHKEIDGKKLWLIPGLSDTHAHLSLISEYDLKIRNLRYFGSQREKNCEEALRHGCTFVKDSGGATDVMRYLRNEIECGRLLGPKVMAATEVVSPRGGMWDMGFANRFAPMIFGGKLINFPSSDRELERTLDRLYTGGCDFFKVYFEDKPLYGGKESTVFTMFDNGAAKLIKRKAKEYGKMVESHSMFIKGSRVSIDAGFDMIAHLTVDEAYGSEDAKKMRDKDVAIIPTLSLGCYLAMNQGTKGYPNHPDFLFFKERLEACVPGMIRDSIIPELRESYMGFYEWIGREVPNRRMPEAGTVWSDRVHGFSKYARENIGNMMERGVKIGIGTDGGTGITFSGNLQVEFEAFHHFGLSPAEILRMATLGNMEILHLEDNLGSITPGKAADLVIIEGNPLDDIHAISRVSMVFKDGRMMFSNNSDDGFR